MCLFQMTFWRQALILLCCGLICVDSAPAPVSHRNKYKNSFRLTRSSRTRVQQLLKKYVSTGLKNQQQLELPTFHLVNPVHIQHGPHLSFNHDSVYFNRMSSCWEINNLRTEAGSWRTCRCFLQTLTAGWNWRCVSFENNSTEDHAGCHAAKHMLKFFWKVLPLFWELFFIS